MKVAARIVPPPPFDLLLTVRLLQRRATSPVDRWVVDRQGPHHLRAIQTEGGPVLAGARQRGETVDLLVPSGTPSARARAAVATMRRVLGLDLPAPDLSPVERLHPELAELATRLEGMRVPCFASLFETVQLVVPFQQVSLEAGTAVLRRLVERFGVACGEGIWATPEPARIARARIESLRACGLSFAKSRTLRTIAGMLLDGELDEAEIEALPSDEAMARLEQLPGIGPWSAGLILLRGFRRLDVFPANDAGVARALAPWFSSPQALAHAAGSLDGSRGLLYFFALGKQLLARGLLEDHTEASGA